MSSKPVIVQIALPVLASLLVLATTAVEPSAMVNADARPTVSAESTRLSHRQVDGKTQQLDRTLYRVHRQLPDRESSCAELPRRRLHEALHPRNGPHPA